METESAIKLRRLHLTERDLLILLKESPDDLALRARLLEVQVSLNTRLNSDSEYVEL